MAGFDITEGIRKAFLAGVGAVATGVEKSSELVDDFIAKGEITVEQGKALNEELSHKAQAAVDDAGDTLLRTRMQAMSAEDRAAYAAKVAKMAEEMAAETVEVEVEEAPAEDATDKKSE